MSHHDTNRPRRAGATGISALLFALTVAGCATSASTPMPVPATESTAAPTKPENASRFLKYSGFLCLKDEATGEWNVQCLDRSKATPTQVRERVAYYNEKIFAGKARLSCARRKSTGTMRMIWDCRRYDGRWDALEQIERQNTGG